MVAASAASIARPYSAAGDQPLGRQLERLEPQHPEPLPVRHDPFVVPVRQELGAVDELADPGERLGIAIVEELAAQGEQLDDVDTDQREQRDAVLVHVDDREAAPLEAPEGRPQAASRLHLRDVRPQGPGQLHPVDRLRWTGRGTRPRARRCAAAPALGRG